jgi:hypothetical protein
MSNEPPQQSGCGIVNLLLPVFLVAGAVLGGNLASPYGWLWGVLGSAAGVFLSVPATGVILRCVLGIAALLDRFSCRTGEDTKSPPSD